MKRTNLFNLLLLGLILHVCSLSYGQVNEQIVRNLQTSPNGGLIKVLRTEQKTTTDRKTETKFQDVLEISGQRITLGDGEYFEDYGQDVILTSKINYKPDGQSEKLLQSYTLKGDNLQKTGTLIIDEITSYKVINDTKNILLSDESEGFGTKISLYSNTLKKIKSYKPFNENGFSESREAFGKNMIAFIFYPIAKNEKTKLVLIDEKSGAVKFEERLNSDIYTITNLTIIGNFIFIKQHSTPKNQELLCYDFTGNLLWKKNEYILDMRGMKYKNKWFALAMDELDYWFIDLASGKSMNKKSLDVFTGGSKIGSELWFELSETADNSQILILVSKRELNLNTFSHDLFVSKDVFKEPSKISTINSADEVLTFKKLSSSLLLTNENNQIIKSYEN